MSKISIVIITFNEELHIKRCIDLCKKITNRIYIIDSYSSDKTVDIAKNQGCTVYQNKFTSHARQFNWGVSQIKDDSEWIMRLDADETVDDKLADEIIKNINANDPEISAYSIKRKHIFMNKWIRHGGRYPLIMTRIWRKGFAIVEDRWMDEHVTVKSGKIKTLSNPFADHNLNGTKYLLSKHNGYADREALQNILEKFKINTSKENNKIPLQAKIKRKIKSNIYNRLPFWMAPTLYYAYRMFIQLGFLDGKEGIIYHTTQGFIYRFAVASRMIEFNAAIKSKTSKNEVLAELEKLTGIDLSALKY